MERKSFLKSAIAVSAFTILITVAAFGSNANSEIRISADDNTEIAFNRKWAEDAFNARSVGSLSDRLRPSVPFSFVYGGRKSSEFLNGWKSQTAFYEMDKGTEADILSHLSAIKGLGFEYLWVDAYYGKDDFPTVGNYVFPLLRGFNLQRFPNGMKPIGEAVQKAGLSRYVPFSASGQMGTTPYLFRSGFNGGISFCEDVRPSEYPRDLLKSDIIEGKRIRKCYFGNFYPLTQVTLDPAAWCVTQYHRTKENDGMIMAFRRPKSQLNEFTLNGLREIEPNAQYKVTRYQSYEPLPTKTMTGEELVRSKAEINDCPGSVLIEYKKVGK
ncbi:MAG: hypothetical protein WC865_02845 [Bacteroidales bacterium]